METNELILKLDKDSTLPLIEGLGKSAYAIAVAHGFRGTEQEWLDSLKGLQGPQGEPGPKGDPFRYEDFTPEQLEALKGPKGDKGEDGRDGASATADNAHQLLLQGNVWCESTNIDDVLTAMIGNIGKPFPRTEFKPLTIPSVIQGQQVVAVTGEPHYSVKVVGNDAPFTLDSTGTCAVTIPPLGEDDIKLTYHNFTGVKVGDYKIAGVQTGAPADDTIEVNGSVYKLYGDVLKINVTNSVATGTNIAFDFIPYAWLSKPIKGITIKANRKVTLLCGVSYMGSKNSTILPSKETPIYVDTPENVSFTINHGGEFDNKLNIGTLTEGTQLQTFSLSSLEYDKAQHRYVNGGYPVAILDQL
jgi:hypothetical protein|nr:MAG TPA: nucleoid-associated protein [Caudoviricetes sp.]